MSSTALKVAAVALVLLTLVLASLGFAVSRNFARRTHVAEATAAKAESARREANKALAVVANKLLPAFKPISKDDLSLVPVAVVPTGYFANVDEIAGRTPLVSIEMGQPVTRRYFKQGGGLATAVPEGMQALALEVNEVVAAGGFIKPGDTVDVLLFLRNGPGVALPQASILLHKALVLAFEDQLIDRLPGDAAPEDNTSGNKRRIRTVVLAVPYKDTNRVMLGASMGDIKLSLNRDNAEAPQANPAITVSDLAIKVPEPKPAADTPPPPPPRPTVEVLHGSTAEQVPQ